MQVHTWWYKALRSACGSRRPLRSLAHKEEYSNKMRIKADIKYVHAFRCKLLGANWRCANAKSSMLQENNPDAACMHEIHTGRKKNGEKDQRCTLLRLEIQANPSRITPANKAALWVLVYVCFGGPGRFLYLRSFWEHSELYKCSKICRLSALVNSVCLLALSRSDRHVLASLLCAGLIALCCAWGRCSTTICPYVHLKKRPTKTTKKMEKNALPLKGGVGKRPAGK